MKLLVFQHIDCEHPGSLREFLAADGIDWRAVNLHNGEAIPKLDDYDALWVMGGPMDVWDIEECPWLIAEKAAIREWVGVSMKPYLGLCLGHQLLADAMGGTCGPQRPAEIGIMNVELTEQGRADALFQGTSAVQPCLQWHSVRVAQEPENTTVLASSRDCRVQAMRVGTNAWSMQYHVEVEPDTVKNWGEVPAYHQALLNSLGADGINVMQQGADENMQVFTRSAETIYKNFMSAIR
ncbi:GMP synthase [Chromatiales bacterium (ex Bugula neritina AB1)]|nr:GMP synthase [Chromatiales bacterium (ex Bugula neritina AB1)]